MPSTGVVDLATVAGLVAGVQRTVAADLPAGTRLVGVTWTGAEPQVRLRWRVAGAWTAWETAESDTDRPTPAEQAGARPGTEPLWAPDGAGAVQVAVRATTSSTGLAQVVAVGDGLALGSGARPAARAATAHPVVGSVLSRADWGADEGMRRGQPAYAARIEAVVIHHTVQSNTYSADDVPALIRADYAYHVRSRGWSDLGYNLLVDRFGRVWEGRAGGVGRPVVGAHASGFNTSTLGVAYLGDAERAVPSPQALDALAKVAAFAGVTGGWSPGGSVTLTSGGSPKYRSGTRVTLPRVFGHRDTDQTACPGREIYGRLQPIRARAVALTAPLPRFGAVQISGVPLHAPVPVRLTSGVNGTVHWVVTVTDPAGRAVAITQGYGTSAVLPWDGQVVLTDPGVPVPVPPGTYAFTIVGNDGLGRQLAPVHGSFEVGVPDAVTLLTR